MKRVLICATYTGRHGFAVTLCVSQPRLYYLLENLESRKLFCWSTVPNCVIYSLPWICACRPLTVAPAFLAITLQLSCKLNTTPDNTNTFFHYVIMTSLTLKSLVPSTVRETPAIIAPGGRGVHWTTSPSPDLCPAGRRWGVWSTSSPCGREGGREEEKICTQKLSLTKIMQQLFLWGQCGLQHV